MTTQFSRDNDQVHDLFRYAKDHMTEREWKHFTDSTKIKFKELGYKPKYDRLFDEYDFGF